MNYRTVASALQTIKATRSNMFMVQTFGSRVSYLDSVTGQIVTIATWRGKEYFLSMKKELTP